MSKYSGVSLRYTRISYFMSTLLRLDVVKGNDYYATIFKLDSQWRWRLKQK